MIWEQKKKSDPKEGFLRSEREAGGERGGRLCSDRKDKAGVKGQLLRYLQ